MGSSSHEGIQNQYQTNHNKNATVTEKNQNVNEQNKNVINPKQNVVIQLPEPKLFEFDPNFLKDCENIQKSTYKDSEYKGQIKNGKRNGKGIMRWKSGIEYQGEFKDGFRQGKGICKYKSGEIYNGEWNMGFQEG